MQCDKCTFENPAGMKFCGQCGHVINIQCPQCQFDNPSNFKFCGNCSAALCDDSRTIKSSDDNNLSTSEHAKGISLDAERRQLTVLFCDVVGSTVLSDSVDPEDLRDIMRVYREACSEVVQNFNGYIAQYLGDGVLVYFGYPHAHEDDVQRAAKTGLALVEKISKLNQQLRKEKSVSLEIRVGIHTGLVVIGGLGGNDKRSMALGVTPNIAARLQDLAQPNTVIVSAETKYMIRNCFDTTSLGEHTLKGFSRPFEIFKLGDERDKLNHHVMQLANDEIPLVGREQEAALLLDKLEQAKQGAGQVVLLSGEAGIGKSRLSQFISNQVKETPHFMLQCCGSSHFKNSYLHSIINVFNRVLELNSDISTEEKIKLLEKPLATFGLPLSTAVPIIAELLSVPVSDKQYQQPQLTPQQRKQQTLDTLLTLILAMSSQRMVFIVMEDLQWIDPTTLELLGKLIGQVPTSKVFILLTYRSEFVPPWTAKAHLSHITINRLTRKQTGRMVNSIANNKLLPIKVFQEIVNKTDGTPFFIEELTKMVLESDLLKEGDEFYELNTPLDSLAIPSTLQDSLMARLDKLGPEKELAQLSATLGREFGHSLLQAIAQPGDPEFEAKLHNLVEAELFYQHGLPPLASYTFRHALVHEVAYQSLLKKTRQQYHHRISKIIGHQFPEMLENSPEIVAHHCSEAGDFEAAIQYWILAGKTAIKRFALIDAMAHLNRGLSLLTRLTDIELSIKYELQIQPILGIACMMHEGYGADSVEKAYGRAYELCRQIGEDSSIAPIICGLWEYYIVRANMSTAMDLATHLLKIAKQSEDSELFLEAQRALGATYFWQGNLTEAYKHLERGIDTNALLTKRDMANKLYSQDPKVANLANASCVLWLLGFPDQALDISKQGIQLAKSLKHPFSLAYAYLFTSIVYQLRGDVESAEIYADKTIQLSDQYNFIFWKVSGTMIKIWAGLKQNADDSLIELFEKSLKEYQNTGSRLTHSYFQALLSEHYLETNKLKQASDTIDLAIKQSKQHGIHFFESELFRIKAEIVARQYPENHQIIADHFNKAIEIAQHQNASSLELRSCLGLCRFLKNRNENRQAISLLNNSMNHFNEGFQSHDWIQANSLLAELNRLVTDDNHEQAI